MDRETLKARLREIMIEEGREPTEEMVEKATSDMEELANMFVEKAWGQGKEKKVKEGYPLICTP